MKKNPLGTSAKTIFLERLFEDETLNPHSNILDMGSGNSTSWTESFKKYPELHYTGIEPFKKSFDKALGSFGDLPNKTFHNTFAYDKIAGFGEFDVCISLSVLEHVKQVEKMLEKSIESVRSGGQVIHWYDLGHALHPCSLKERFHVFLGTHLPFLLPEQKFACYLDYKKVAAIMEKNGVENISVSNYQFRTTKSCLKAVKTDEEYDQVVSLTKWEHKNQSIIQAIPRKEREFLYPSVLVMGTKK